MSRSDTAKYHALDAYRFLAAMGVVLLHYSVDFKIVADGRWPFVEGMRAMVDFFFLLSGFVIAVSYRDRMASPSDYGVYLKARFARIYPLHLATFAIVALAALAAARVGLDIGYPKNFGADGVIPTLLLTQAWGMLDHDTFNAPAWSLSAEFFVYLLTPLAFWLARRLSTRVMIALAIALYLALELARAQAGLRPLSAATWDFGVMRALAPFLVGVALGFAAPRLRAWASGRGAPFARWSLAHLVGALILVGLCVGLPMAALVALFAAMVALAAACEGAGLKSRLSATPMRALGDMSFAIYLLHPVVYKAVSIPARRLGLIDGGAGSLAAALATTALVLAAAWVCYRWFEAPARRRINALALRRHAAVPAE